MSASVQSAVFEADLTHTTHKDIWFRSYLSQSKARLEFDSVVGFTGNESVLDAPILIDMVIGVVRYIGPSRVFKVLRLYPVNGDQREFVKVLYPVRC